MGLFKKQKPTVEPVGRRRPIVSDPAAQRTQAFSYYAQRKSPQANTGRGQSVEPITEQNRSNGVRWRQNRFITIPGGIVVLVAVCWLLALSTDPKIVPVSTGGSVFLHDTADYHAMAANVLGGSIFNHSKLTVDTAKVSQELISKYPEIHTASVTIPFIGSQPVVRITPYKPALILITSESQAFLVDETGRALALTSQISNMGELAVPTVEDKSSLSVQRGAQALSGNTAQFISEVVRLLDAAKVKPSSLTLPAGTSELDVAISGTPYFVKFNLQGDARLQTGTFLAAKQRLERDKSVPSQYVDVRVPERAYYK